MKFKAVIFDMDGVLVDSEPLHVSVVTSMFVDYKIPLSKNMFNRFAGSTSLSMWKTLSEEFNLKMSVAELSAENINRFVNTLNSTDGVQLFDGVREVLTNLNKKGIPIALASSSNKPIVESVMNKFDLKQYFNTIVTGNDVKHSKPHPEIFLTASRNLGVPPMECIVVEDSPNGVKAAHAAGMSCIGFASDKNHHDISYATWLIKSFGEFDYNLV